VFLSRIVSQDVLQADFFSEYSLEREYKKARLMYVVDLLNEWWGSNTLYFGAQGIERRGHGKCGRKGGCLVTRPKPEISWLSAG
jgi:hypothetical protein